MTTIAIANQKGGVGKTTIALALATAIADLVKRRVLLIDLDTQANATVGLGQRPQPNLARWLMFEEPLGDVVIHVGDRLDLVASNSKTDVVNLDLANGAKIQAVKIGLKTASYDYIIIDCPPSLAMITRAGLFAADYILTPVDCEFFASQGLVMLSAIIQQVQEQGSRTRWLGVIPNKYRPVKVHQVNVGRLYSRFDKKFVWDALPLTTQIARTQEAGQTIWTCPDVDRRHRATWAGMVKRVLWSPASKPN
jgi:chromosome partitioning protein